MIRRVKRAREIIDLTDDHDSRETQAKRPAVSSTHPGQLNSRVTSAHPDRPDSSGLYNAQTADAACLQSGNNPETCLRRPHPISNASISSTQEPGVLDPTQRDEGPAREFYGSLDGRIVGVRYYRGFASPGELVLCLREPLNQYDCNAIRVDNVMRQQIGHLPRKVVEKLAPYIDRGDILLEAELAGEKGLFDCPIRLSFFGPSEPLQRSRIETALKNDKLIKAAQLKETRKAAETRRTMSGLRNGGTTAGFGGVGSFITEPELSLDDILQNSKAVEMRQGTDAVRSIAVGEQDLANMAQAEQPQQLLSKLLPYQLQGLAWMTRKEDPPLPTKESNNVVQLWRLDSRGLYWNVASDFVSSSPPRLFSGGILADDMGLGKTLQVISLILTGGPGATLIVSPVSVMSNWEQQIRRHVKPGRMPRVLLYYGDTKALRPQDLMEYDVVITSYGKVAREKDDGVTKVLLSQSIGWRRVVLDEGHTIRNAKTKVAIAASEIKAKCRWVLTGTPIINSVNDLQSLVKFLHLSGGIEHPEVFNTKITRKLSAGDRGAESLLQALMQDICLRRTKDMKFVDLKLPEKKEYAHRIPFRPDEKQKYESLLSEARGALEEYQSRSQAGQRGRFQNVLERLLRLRQTCNHWTLCRQRIDNLLNLLEDQNVVPFTERNRGILQEALRLFVESQEECAICYELPTGPVITNCKHVFCHSCILKAIEIQHKCPMCRNDLSPSCLLKAEVEGFDDRHFDPETQSSKTEAMIQIVKATIKKPGSKVVIFSQWTSFLNIVEGQLAAAGITFTRLDGSMNTEKRDRAVQQLEGNPDVTVMLASLAVCGVGLNLVAADTVILCDSWWAPAVEDQAVDRVHRLGQTRETTVWRLVMEGSIEERVLDIQQEKRLLVNKTFQHSDAKRKQARETRMADVVKLLS